MRILNLRGSACGTTAGIVALRTSAYYKHCYEGHLKVGMLGGLYSHLQSLVAESLQLRQGGVKGLRWVHLPVLNLGADEG